MKSKAKSSDWHKHGGKYSKFFLKLEKNAAFKAKYKSLYLETQKLLKELKFLRNSKKIYQKIYEKATKSETEINTLWDRVEAPELSEIQIHKV